MLAVDDDSGRCAAGLYLFTSSGADASVSPGELDRIAIALLPTGVPTDLSDYVFIS